MTEPTVFIIDDDPSARRGLTRLVRAAGMNAESFASAEDFLASGECNGPGCIVLDVRMPDMDGPKLAQELRKYRPKLKVLYTSGYTAGELNASGLLGTRVEFVQKPVEPDALFRRVRCMLDA